MRDPLDGQTLELLDQADDLDDLPRLAAEMLSEEPGLWPRQLAELTDLLEDELMRGEDPLEPIPARRLACRLMARLAVEFGGSQLYLPKDDALMRSIRDQRLWIEFDGSRHGPRGVNALARREKMTPIHLYRILAQQRSLHRQRVEPDLFSSGG